MMSMQDETQKKSGKIVIYATTSWMEIVCNSSAAIRKGSIETEGESSVCNGAWHENAKLMHVKTIQLNYVYKQGVTIALHIYVA